MARYYINQNKFLWFLSLDGTLIDKKNRKDTNMNTDILYDNEKQKNATERVLATVRIKSINKEIDEFLNELLKYATNIDTILERNGEEKRYLNRVSKLDEMTSVSLDDDLSETDFRVKEVIEDLIKRINTRINLIRNNDELIKEIESTYDLSDADFDSDIKDAKLESEDFE